MLPALDYTPPPVNLTIETVWRDSDKIKEDTLSVRRHCERMPLIDKNYLENTSLMTSNKPDPSESWELF